MAKKKEVEGLPPQETRTIETRVRNLEKMVEGHNQAHLDEHMAKMEALSELNKMKFNEKKATLSTDLDDLLDTAKMLKRICSRIEARYSAEVEAFCSIDLD